MFLCGLVTGVIVTLSWCSFVTGALRSESVVSA